MKDLGQRLKLDLLVGSIKRELTLVSLLRVLFWLTVALQTIGFRKSPPLMDVMSHWPPANLPGGHWLRYGASVLAILALFLLCFRLLLDRRRARSFGSLAGGAEAAGWTTLRPHLFALAVAVAISFASIAGSKWVFNTLDPLPERKIAGVILAEAGPPGDISYETIKSLMYMLCMDESQRAERSHPRCEYFDENPGFRARLFDTIFLAKTFGRAAPAMIFFHLHLILMTIVYLAVCYRLAVVESRAGEETRG